MRIDGKLTRITDTIEAVLRFIAPLGAMTLVCWVTHQPIDCLNSGSREASWTRPSPITEEE